MAIDSERNNNVTATLRAAIARLTLVIAGLTSVTKKLPFAVKRLTSVTKKLPLVTVRLTVVIAGLTRNLQVAQSTRLRIGVCNDKRELRADCGSVISMTTGDIVTNGNIAANEAAMPNGRAISRMPRAFVTSCLAMMLCLSMLPIVAFAEESQPLPEEQTQAEQLEPQATPGVSAGWIKSYGGSKWESFNSVIATTDGSYVAVGFSESSDGDLSGNKGWDDFVIAKFDASGNKLWFRNYGGSGIDCFNSVIATTDGGYVAVGTSASSGGDLSGNKGDRDFIIAKFDASGNKVWIKNYGGSKDDSFSSVIATSDGSYVAVGYSESSNGDLSGNKGYTDFVIAKFNASGNKVWMRNYGGSSYDQFNSVVATVNGGYTAVGYSRSSNGDLSGNKGDTDFVIAKFDTNGNKTWIRNYGGSDKDYFNSVVVASDGNYVVAGDSASSNGDLPGNNDSVRPAGHKTLDFVIAKFDTNGSKVWIKNYGGLGDDGFDSIVATTNGSYVAVGETRSWSLDVSDFAIAKFDANGNEVWTKNYDWGSNGTNSGHNVERFYSVAVTPDGGFVAVGQSHLLHGVPPNSQVHSDFIIAKFNQDGNLPLTRKAGATRHQTAALASQAAYPEGSTTAIIANASNYPDALAASTLAGKVKAPILLSPKDKLDSDTQAELIRLKPTTVYIVGSTGAISNNVANQLKTLSSVKEVKRLGGADRFATGKLIADAAVGGSTTKVNEIYLVSGDNFPDALSVSSISVIKHIPVILTSQKKLSNEALAFINNHKVGKVTIIGGTASVSQTIEDSLVSKLGKTNVTRLAGTDRYETAHKVLTTLAAGLKPTVIGVATGDAFPDALSGGASLGARGGILVLTPSKILHTKTKTHLQTLTGNKPFIEILGGSASISDGVQREVKGMFGY